MDHLVVAYVNAHMGDPGSVGAAEEDEVSDLRVVDVIRAVVIAVCAGAVDVHAGLFVGVVDKAAAVESAWACAAPDVRYADVVLRCVDENIGIVTSTAVAAFATATVIGVACVRCFG